MGRCEGYNIKKARMQKDFTSDCLYLRFELGGKFASK